MHTTSNSSNTKISAAPDAHETRSMARQVMSSREIAALTDKQHKNVIRDIRVMLIELYGSDELESIIPEKNRNRHTEYIRENAGLIMDRLFGHGSSGSHDNPRGFSWFRDTRGYVSEFHLNRELTDTLITGYSTALRNRVIRRWHELEARVVFQMQIPQSFADALRLAADQAEENHNLRMTITQQQPKVEALNRLADTTGSVCITDAAKHIGMPPLKLFDWLSKNRWIYRRSSSANWSAFQPRLSSGVLEHKLVEIKNHETKELKVVEQVMVTRRGLVQLAAKINGAEL